MKRTGITVLLSVVLLIGVVCGVYFMRQAAQLRADGENTVAAAESTLAEAQARHDAVDPNTETGAAAWTAAEQEVFDETREKIDALKADKTDEIKAKLQALTTVIQTASQGLYQQAGSANPNAQQQTPPKDDSAKGKGDDGVVDAEVIN